MQVSLLSGILFDARGERMTPTHATKNNTRYRYYVSRSLLAGAMKYHGHKSAQISLPGDIDQTNTALALITSLCTNGKPKAQ